MLRHSFAGLHWPTSLASPTLLAALRNPSLANAVVNFNGQFSVVPEPASLELLMIGAAIVAAGRLAVSSCGKVS